MLLLSAAATTTSQSIVIGSFKFVPLLVVSFSTHRLSSSLFTHLARCGILEKLMPQQEVSQTTFDSSSSRPEAREGAERRGESSRTIGTSSQSEAEALLALLNATNVDLHEASEGTHFLGGGADDHSSQALETLRVHGRTALDRTRNLDGELGNIGPSHAAIVLSPADSTSALEHLSNAMDELLAGHPGPADVAAVEQNGTVEHRSNTSIRMPVLRQRSRSNVETQTSSQAQTQGRTPPQRPTRDEFAFYLSVMPDSRRASGNDRHQEARPQDAASTTLGRRVAARTASAQGQENHNAEQWSRLAFRSRHRGRTSMTYATNAIGMSIQNVNENGSGTSNARPVTIEEDSYLPRLLDGLQTSEDEAGGRESSDTERDEDLRLRILALASADNAHALQTENTSGNTLRGTYNARTHTLLSTSGRSTPELVWPTQNFSRNTSANGHSVPQSVAISHPTSHTGSQTEDVFFPRSPSPTVFDEGVRIRPRAGPFREVVETVQSSRGSYQIRRHVNARGEEQVHQIRAAENMWDDFESSFYESPGASLTRRPSAVDRRLSESWESILRNRERLRARNAERTNSTQNASARTRATVQFPPSFPRELASAPGIQANFASTRPSASSSTSSSSSGATRRRGWGMYIFETV